MAAKGKSILQKRLAESEQRLKEAIDRLAKAAKAYDAKNDGRVSLEKEKAELAARLEEASAKREEALARSADLEEKIGLLEKAARETAAGAPAAAPEGDAEALRKALRQRLDGTIARLEALIEEGSGAAGREA